MTAALTCLQPDMENIQDIFKHRGSLFLTVEGTDGSGKSTQAELLKKKLEPYGETILVQEPGTTELGTQLRRMLLRLDGPMQACHEAELMLFLTARVQLMHEIIYPALNRGAHVICDRGIGSTIAYQCCGASVSYSLTRAVLKALENHLWRDATHSFTRRMIVVCDVPAEVAKSRMQGKKLDHWESQDDGFKARVRHAFRNLHDLLPEHHVVHVDATRDVGAVTDKIWHDLTERLELLDQRV